MRLSRRSETGEGRREIKMKKSLMPCERRDLSSVTPDEPASGGLRGKGECQTSGYIHSSPKKASHTTSTPIEPIGQRIRIPCSRTRLFLIADRRKNRRLIRTPRMKFVTESLYLTFPPQSDRSIYGTMVQFDCIDRRREIYEGKLHLRRKKLVLKRR